ncbi:L-proline dehydrogenase [Salegentibacter holothuriorum]|uniref:L-proline dehydrogenase n=1 Tax=Salegentibacter holothuriorum TaxID=241145 RepID=A0A1T5ALG2_9FLAO|nr:proline dehydrogenase family protein [Salegentibacter holothuriorum]SKB35637.1 L-proline dehydrogenase [Salegentibacter holothuriorum]
MINRKIFNDTKTAFKLKSDLELDRAIFLFSMMNKKTLVDAGSWLTKFSLKLHLPVEGIIKKTIFEQFCGGITEEDCKPLTKEMYSKKLHSILDYSVEGKETEEQFDAALAKKMKLIKFAAESEELPFSLFKPTGIGRFAIWEKITERVNLSDDEKEEWERVKERVDALCNCAYENDVRLYADAEESWMQLAADELMEDMMKTYNKDKILIYNTFQCYRWDRLEYVKNLHEKAKKEGFKIGAKIVRGAYMEKENARAKKYDYTSPICENKEATDVNFNSVMSYCLANLGDIHLFIGTHNEVSNYLALQSMEDKGLPSNDDRIWFSQLYGMSDHISFNLAKKGYNSAKLLPFGPVREVVPYLLRRAQENTSVKGQTGRELSLLQEEKKRRKGQPTKHDRGEH